MYGRVTSAGWTADSYTVTADSSITTDGGAGSLVWMVVETGANGNNDLVYFTALIQCLLLNLNEAPFYATSGIPAQQSVIQQVFPDYYVALTQQNYSQYFASLQVVKVTDPYPSYQITAITTSGVTLNANIAVPT